MINIKEEIEICLLKERLSMRKLANMLRENGFDVPKDSGLSNQFRKKRIRFETVQEILDFLGYELTISKKKQK